MIIYIIFGAVLFFCLLRKINKFFASNNKNLDNISAYRYNINNGGAYDDYRRFAC